jgi:hypothetical protein
MKSFDRDFDWQRGLIPEIKRVLANYLIVEAPADEDMKHNTDLIVLKLDTIRVACRVRTHGYLDRYPDEFTIRASRPSGQETELAKMLAGWGDYIFYGFATEEGQKLAAWMLGDLKVFRLWHSRELWDGRKPGKTQRNGDGSSTFQAYRISDLPSEFVVARVQPRSVAA